MDIHKVFKMVKTAFKKEFPEDTVNVMIANHFDDKDRFAISVEYYNGYDDPIETCGIVCTETNLADNISTLIGIVKVEKG